MSDRVAHEDGAPRGVVQRAVPFSPLVASTTPGGTGESTIARPSRPFDR